MRPRIIYMGTPEFAAPALQALAERDDLDLGLVVTQPDRPAGRGRQVQAPPVKVLAESLGLPVYQPRSLRSAEERQPVVDIAPDLIVVAAYGLILGRSVLDLPRRGCVNLHASILPRYRGASPISAAILNGDRETGVTLMDMERGLDTGPMIDIARLDIVTDDTTASLTGRLAAVSADLLIHTLDALLDGSSARTPQPAGASLTRPLVKGDGWIDWTQPARGIERQVRAMWSWPRAWTTLPDGGVFQVHLATVIDVDDDAPQGAIRQGGSRLQVRCGDAWLQVERGQLAGGKPLSGAQLASNRALAAGTVLGGGQAPTVPGPMVKTVTGEPAS